MLQVLSPFARLVLREKANAITISSYLPQELASKFKTFFPTFNPSPAFPLPQHTIRAFILAIGTVVLPQAWQTAFIENPENNDMLAMIKPNPLTFILKTKVSEQEMSKPGAVVW